NSSDCACSSTAPIGGTPRMLTSSSSNGPRSWGVTVTASASANRLGHFTHDDAKGTCHMMQQWRRRFCGLILAAAFLASDAAHAEEKIYIVTSLPDLADIAARIGRDLGTVETR